MRMIAAIAAVIGLTALAWSAPPDDKNPIRLPVIRGEVPPSPIPANNDVVIERETLYVVEADVELLAFTSPGGAVKVTKDVGPLRIRARFADGKGVETRNFAAKHLVIVEALGEGRDELLIVPVGAKNESEARRVFLRVGTLPQPPPPGPGPKPEPKPVSTFRVIIGYESGQTMTQDQVNVVYGGDVEKYLNEKCTGGKVGWRRRDKDSNGDEDRTMAALWNAIKPKITSTPFFAVEVNGQVEIIPLESTQAAMIAKLKTYRGE